MALSKATRTLLRKRCSFTNLLLMSPTAATESENGASGGLDELSAVTALNAILRHRRWVVGATVFVSALMLPIALTRPVTYTSTASFLPDVSRPGQGGMNNLAAQFGVNLAQTSGTASPQFYPLLIRNAQFLGRVADAPLRLGASDTTMSYAEAIGIESRDTLVRRRLAAEELQDAVVPTMEPQTSLITVAVTASSPKLAQQVCAQILRQVNEFNLNTRQGRAGAERKFVELRLAELRDDLRAAEERLQTFAKQNRDFSRAPDLQMMFNRLQREVLLQQQVYTSLAQNYEQAKIDEVRDTPVITVVSQPDYPIRPNGRGRMKFLIAGLAGGLALGIMLALLIDFVRGPNNRERSDVAELSRIMREIRADAAKGRVFRVVLGPRSESSG